MLNGGSTSTSAGDWEPVAAGSVFSTIDPGDGGRSSKEGGGVVDARETHRSAARVNEGSACLLKRPGHPDIYFAVPIRPRPKVTPDSLTNTIVLDFD